MKIFLKLMAILWLAVCLFAGVGFFLDTPMQIKADKKFINRELRPSVDFVKKFKTINSRLPTTKEFDSWEREYYYKIKPGNFVIQYLRGIESIDKDDLSKFKNADWTKDFAIAVWRGEWMQYYFSWSDNYDPNNYAWDDGFTVLAIMFVLGLLPLLAWWVIRKQKRKILHNTL
jgi:hypothetical protein